jgi:hypothetical protein
MKWKQQYSSLVVIAAGFIIVYLLTKNYWMLIPAVVATTGFFINPLGLLIQNGWMKLAKLLGYINSRILLFVLFFLVLTPIALLMRLLGKNTYIRSATGKRSLFTGRNHQFTKADFEHPF